MNEAGMQKRNGSNILGMTQSLAKMARRGKRGDTPQPILLLTA
jgi:hypothetical protein